jgi:hypothetical protein
MREWLGWRWADGGGLIGRVTGAGQNFTAQHSQIRQCISQGLVLRTVAILLRIQASLDGAVSLLNPLGQFDWIEFKQRRLIGRSPVILVFFVHEITSNNARPFSCGSLLENGSFYRYRYNADDSRCRNSCLFDAVQSAPLTAYPGHR